MLSSSSDEIPNEADILEYIKKLENAWSNVGENILSALNEITGLSWYEENVVCYVVGKHIPFSDPLTIPVYALHPIDYAIDVVTHELIHRLLLQPKNIDDTEAKWSKLYEEMDGQSENVIDHVRVHAVHELLYLKLFDEGRLARDKAEVAKLAEYKQAWDIVEERGAQDIVSQFV